MIPDAVWKNYQVPWKIEWVGRSVSTNAEQARPDDDDSLWLTKNLRSDDLCHEGWKLLYAVMVFSSWVVTIHIPGVPKKVWCLIWCKLKTTVSTLSIFIFSELSNFDLEFGMKQSKMGWNFTEQWLPEAKTSGLTDEQRSRFFQGMHQFKAAILLYQSSLGLKNFVKFSKKELFYLVIKLTKSFAVPKACTRWNTKRGIGIIYFRGDNCTDVIENFLWGTQVCKWQTQLQNFHKKSYSIFFASHRKQFDSFIWEVPWFFNNGCSEFLQVNWPSYNIYSLISP